MYVTLIDCSEYEDIYMYNGFSNNFNTSVLNAVKEYIKCYHDSYSKLELYSIIQDKETLNDNEVLEIQNIIRPRNSISTEECKERIELDKIYFTCSRCYYKDNVLYIVNAENNSHYVNVGDIIKITEEQSNRIESVKLTKLDTSSIRHDTKIPNWAAKYICNNTDNEDLKSLILNYSDLKFFT